MGWASGWRSVDSERRPEPRELGAKGPTCFAAGLHLGSWGPGGVALGNLANSSWTPSALVGEPPGDRVSIPLLRGRCGNLGVTLG